jgi:hypothetical protein
MSVIQDEEAGNEVRQRGRRRRRRRNFAIRNTQAWDLSRATARATAHLPALEAGADARTLAGVELRHDLLQPVGPERRQECPEGGWEGRFFRTIVTVLLKRERPEG